MSNSATKIDYDRASSGYDRSRGVDRAVLRLIAERGAFARRDGRQARVLDFGCGTGNYLREIARLYDCELFGLEPSEGMRLIAAAKNPGAKIEDGDHGRMPFERGFFDFAFMTDVIHHVGDLDLLFETLAARLAPAGELCVVTESWSQIEARWYNAYFPSLAANEKARYPELGEIERRAASAGLNFVALDEDRREGAARIDETFLGLVEAKGYSMFRLLGEAEYEAGLEALRRDLGASVPVRGAGSSLLWFRKGGRA